MPLLLDTGAADMWVLSDACPDRCNSSNALYSEETFSTLYGIRISGDITMSGSIGTDSIGVGVGGLNLRDQVFTSVNGTNASWIGLGISGLFPLGFPIISDHAFGIYHRQHSQVNSTVIASWMKYGPLVSRLAMQGTLLSPLVAITLQRDTVDIGGNLGMLSIGQLPAGVRSSDMTWVPLRTYTPYWGSGIIVPPADSPSEVYPQYWEVIIDNVYLDGEKLPLSTFSSTPGVSALLDTADSLIRGPSDVIDFIHGTNAIYKCEDPHVLSFEIGGKIFSVDPRDFVRQLSPNSVESCQANLQSRGPPKVDYHLHSWTLGIPFLKGVLVSIHYGNITHPFQDPAKAGFLSTVSNNAGELLKAAVANARKTGNFSDSTQLAPSYLPTAAGTNSHGVPQAVATSSDLR